MIQIAYDPIYAHPLPENHRFPMLKYELIPQQLLHEGTCTTSHFFRPGSCQRDVILDTHDEVYLDKLLLQQLSQQIDKLWAEHTKAMARDRQRTEAG